MADSKRTGPEVSQHQENMETREVDEVTLAFQKFALELPDFDQDLAAQAPGKVLEEFTCFKGLAVEIRLQIWSLMFPPGRKVNILPSKACKSSVHDDQCKCIPKHTPLPVTLFVNQESRAETLKHFAVVHRDPRWTLDPSLNGTPQPLCFNPMTDILYINDSHNNKKPWIVDLAMRNLRAHEQHISQVKVFEIRDWTAKINFPPHAWTWEVAAGTIFPNLKEIRVRLSDRYIGDKESPRVRNASDRSVVQESWTDYHEALTKQMFADYFRTQSQAKPGFVAPKVTILYWTKLEMD